MIVHPLAKAWKLVFEENEPLETSLKQVEGNLDQKTSLLFEKALVQTLEIDDAEMEKLSLQAHFFCSIYKNHFRESTSHIVILKGISFEKFSKIYNTPEITSDIAEMMELIKVADYLGWMPKLNDYFWELTKFIGTLPLNSGGLASVCEICALLPCRRDDALNEVLSKYFGSYLSRVQGNEELNDLIALLNHFGIAELHVEKPMEALKRVNCLRSIWVTNHEIENEDLQPLADMALTQLNISGCTNISEAGIALIKGMPLKSLNLARCEKLNDAALAHLSGMPLERLVLDGCNITDAGMVYLQEMPLQRVYLNFCSAITNRGLSCFQKAAFKELSLCFCTNLGNDSLAYLANMPLEVLYLSACPAITDEGLKYLHKMPLKVLNLSGCDNITDTGLNLLQKLPLTHLYLSECKKISAAGKTSFKGALPELIVR